MRRARAAVALATLGLLVSAPDAGAAEGATITAVGWWTSVPVTSAPEGGVAVGRGGGDPIAVAAIQLSVDEELPTTAELTLTEADGVGADVATLQVCPTPNDWEPVAAGAMADAPRPECGRGSVTLERADDGTWSGDVASLLEPGQPSLMVLPGEADPADSAPTPPFQLSFEPPALSAPAASTTTAQADPTPAPRPAASATPAPTPASSFAPPPPPAAASVTTTTVSSPEPEPTDEVAIGPSVSFPTATTAAAREDRPWGQMLFFLVISALAGTAAGVGRRQLRLRRA
jgi:hypothetical protein